MIVLDASAALAVLLRQPGSEALAGTLLADHGAVHAPHLIDLEVAQVLRRYERCAERSAGRAARALAWFRDLAIMRHAHEPLLERIWRLRANLTAYDAAYVALAEALDAPLLTADHRLAGTAGHRALVEVL